MQPGGSMSDDILRVSNSNDMNELDDRVLQDLYMWVDQIPLSRPKKNIARDFSDGVLVAEICKHFFPQHVELHNYAAANNTKQKIENWYLLNRKVFKKLKFEISDEVIRQVGACRPWVIEHVLLLLRSRIDRVLYQRGATLSRTASDDNVALGGGDVSFRGMGGNPIGAKDYNVVHVGSINKHVGNQGYPQPQMANAQPHPLGFAPAGPNRQPPQPGFRQQPGQLPLRPSQLPRPPQNGRHDHQAIVEAAMADKVPRVAIEEKEQELLAKDETIQILQAKVRRLEHLVHLKDIRIDELQQKLQQIQTGGAAPSQMPQNGPMMPGGGGGGGGGPAVTSRLAPPTQRMLVPNGAGNYRGHPGGNQAMMMQQQNMAKLGDGMRTPQK